DWRPCKSLAYALRGEQQCTSRLRLRLDERALGRRYDGGKRSRLADRQVGQDLAVELQPREFHAVHELRVGHAVLAHAGIDALDPQSAEVAFFVAAVAVGIAQRLLDLLDRDPIGGAA